MGILQIGPVNLADSLPPRTPVNRSRTRRIQLEPGIDGEEAIWDFGLAGGFLHVFQSEERTGFVTYAQMVQLQTLEQSGNPFTVETDFFGPEDQGETFSAYFDPEQKPLYSPAFDDGEEWFFQLPLYLIPQGG